MKDLTVPSFKFRIEGEKILMMMKIKKNFLFQSQTINSQESVGATLSMRSLQIPHGSHDTLLRRSIQVLEQRCQLDSILTQSGQRETEDGVNLLKYTSIESAELIRVTTAQRAECLHGVAIRFCVSQINQGRPFRCLRKEFNQLKY